MDPFMKSLGRVFQEIPVEEALIILAIHEVIPLKHWDYGTSASDLPNLGLYGKLPYITPAILILTSPLISMVYLPQENKAFSVPSCHHSQ
jgi:hypothetical protein